MTENILFSVLLPVYINDSLEYVEEAINSIFINQTVTPNEIVIIADGPLENSVNSFILSLEKKYTKIIQYYKYPENMGLGFALQYGLSHCSHELVARMDADDIADSGRFEVQCKFFKDNPDTALLGGQIQEFDSSQNKLKRIQKYIRKVPTTDKSIKRYLKWRNPFNHMTVMFKKTKILEAGGYKTRLFFEDYDLWFRMASLDMKMRNVPDILVLARTGLSMLERRHGFDYAKKEYSFFKENYKTGMISAFQFLKIIFFRISFRLLPKIFLKGAYRISRQ